MAKRTTTPIKKAPDQPQRICGDCGLGTWVDSFNNLDWQGKPICLTCPIDSPYFEGCESV